MKDAASHGGAFFSAIGEDFRHLERASRIISADVLDAWFDPAPAVLKRLREHLPFLMRTSPPLHAEGLTEAIAAARGLPRECILTGAGSSSLLFHCLPRLVRGESLVVLLDPTYSEYEYLCDYVIGASILRHRLEGDFRVKGEKLTELCREVEPQAVLLVNPNNPTGQLWKRRGVEKFLSQLSDEVFVLVDETYIDFAGEDESLEKLAARRPNMAVVKSMSKAYALGGFRIGYLVAEPALVGRLRKFLPPWPAGLPAQVAAVEALRHISYYRRRWQQTRRLRESQRRRLKARDTDANWVLLEVDEPKRVAASLREKGIFVREFSTLNPEWDNRMLRIAIKSEAQNRRIAAAVRHAL